MASATGHSPAPEGSRYTPQEKQYQPDRAADAAIVTGFPPRERNRSQSLTINKTGGSSTIPQRFLRPGLTNSDRWNKCSFEAQSFWIRILTLVDDYGRYDGRIPILHGHCFAMRPDVGAQQTAALRRELQENDLIQVYEVEGRDYVQVLQWQERIRKVKNGEIPKSKWPDPPAIALQDSAAERCAAQGKDASLAIAITPSPSALAIASSPAPAVPQGGPRAGKSLPTENFGRDGTLTLPDAAKALICKKILGGKDPKRPWSYEAETGLSRLLPLPIAEIEDIATFRSVPKSHDIPELKARRDPITETTLMNYWGDELQRARAYLAKQRPPRSAASRQPDPKNWRVFFTWKYGPDCILPPSFWKLDSDQQSEWKREHEDFERANQELVAA